MVVVVVVLIVSLTLLWELSTTVFVRSCCEMGDDVGFKQRLHLQRSFLWFPGFVVFIQSKYSEKNLSPSSFGKISTLWKGTFELDIPAAMAI